MADNAKSIILKGKNLNEIMLVVNELQMTMAYDVTATDPVVKDGSNVTTDTAITREADGAFQTELLFSKDNVDKEYFLVINFDGEIANT